MQVNILQAKNQLSQLIKYVQAGDEVVIANRGAPVAQLIGLSQDPTLRGSSKLGFLHWLETNPLPTYAQQTMQEIDASIADQRSSWD